MTMIVTMIDHEHVTMRRLRELTSDHDCDRAYCHTYKYARHDD